MLSYHVDGLILTESSHTAKTIKMIQTAGVPVVETMDLPEQPIDMAVGLDHRAAAAAMVEQMISHGKSRILYLGARMDVRTRLRMEGYNQAMVSHGLRPVHVLTEESSCFTLGSQLIDKALDQHPDTDGVFCTNDDIAVGALLRCQEKGVQVPEQVAIAGYNALDIGRTLSPSLASVHTPRKEMGEAAAAMLLKRLAGEKSDERYQDLGYELVLGGSIG